ncbi:hypothetical protein K431DRAFT_228875 [Polychaeton citri CBS 116435]|uniref:Nucleoside diphosphatase n=1 Tax=Polychaeton citri CBS 116435 TaxID=1314669 RepID=A0A9P4Q4H4_9PEZI|nr:hypothetical protein K431DRAFT_228875 [Polychaeton citri CBS 116435]
MGKYRHGVVLDAGSSGSRVYVYKWKNAQYALSHDSAKDLDRLPHIKTKKKWRLKVHPGVSTFGEKPELVGPEHLKDLVEFAQGIVGEEDEPNTPIFLLATAGMRLLPEHQRTAVLENICSYFQTHSNFQLPDCGLHVQVIPGETEGLYGWIAANYLLGGFDAPQDHQHGNGHHTYGFLDMGGASAQIAFAPNATEAEAHANDLKLLRLRKINGEALEYKVFVTTWLGFGANEARRRYVEALVESYPTKEHEIPDPCLPSGLVATLNGTEIEKGSPAAKGKEPHLLGTGEFKECLAKTYPLLEKDAACEDAPCLLNGQHTPAIDFNVNHFVGVSEYWHTTHEVFAAAHGDKAYDFHTYSKQVTEFCSRDWEDIQEDVAKKTWGHKVDTKTVEEVCFKASWLISMLHDGIGIPGKDIEAPPSHGNKTKEVIAGAKDSGFLDPFQAVDDIDGKEVSWTLGKMVLYAASQMPAASEKLAVGFGSNQPGRIIPTDFQPAGGNSNFLPGDLDEGVDSLDDDVPTEWHDRILTGSNSRRIPGILLFLVILALAAYLLWGRERRTSWWYRMRHGGGKSSSPPRGRKSRKNPAAFLSSKLFGTSASLGPAYERVHDLEGGGAAAASSNTGSSSFDDPSSFELASIDSSSEYDGAGGRGSADTHQQEPPRTGRTSGWATPAARALSPDFNRTSPKGKLGYFEHPGSGAHGLGITPFDRGGLMSRAESKERLGGMLGGGKSRTGSPTRRSPLMTPFKESMD